jgi:tetratricopeptide (TPR) repeat protein
MTTLLRVLAVSFTLLLCAGAGAQESSASARDAGRHFQRGVTLYGEADYRAALVEFRRAYAIAPHVAVLYNIGEAQYQLQDYAAALTTFDRYLAESTPTDSRRTEVETNVEILRARVGHIGIATIPSGADVTVDDQPVGRTPIERPVLVSIGHRKVVATIAGRPPVTRYVDVATDDNLTVTLPLPEVTTTSLPAVPRTQLPAIPPDAAPVSHAGAIWRGIGWTTTGLLAAGAVTFGVLADKSSNDLSTARSMYPVSQATLEHDANLTSIYAMVADSLAVGALVIGGATLFSALSSSSEGSPPHERSGAARVTLGPASARFELTF